MFSRRKPSSANDVPLMRAVEIARGGSEPGVLYASRVPMPSAGPHEVLVKVAYAGVNRADLLQVEGNYSPPEGASPLPGLEVSGTIIAVGEKVVGWGEGERVCALLAGGGYAEYVAVPAGQLLSIPGRVSLREAASLPEGVATAYMALSGEARLKPYERVLVHGGSSGTGSLIAQVARAWGAEVYATAGGPKKAKFVSELGVTAIDHTVAPFAEQVLKLTRNEGVDVIVDILGAPQLATHLKLLRPRGRLISLAMMEGGRAEEVRLGALLLKQLKLRGTMLRSRTPEEKADIIQGVHKHIWPHLSTGVIRPSIDHVFPLEEAEKGHQRMQERLHCGKILLEVAPE